MTRCVKGPWNHSFPSEDATGAYCEEHGITLLFNPAPSDLPEYLDDDLVCPEPQEPAEGPTLHDRESDTPVRPYVRVHPH